jgi:hypothetical protein
VSKRVEVRGYTENAMHLSDIGDEANDFADAGGENL